MGRRLLLLLCCVIPASAETTPGAGRPPVIVDPLTDATHWQLGGHRINYQLGRSSVTVSSEQPREGFRTALKLTYDFTDPRRGWMSYYHNGRPIVGRCLALQFGLYGDASGARLRLAIEDGQGRWFQHDAGRLDWTGWRFVTASLEYGSWPPLLRIGEAAQPMQMPINLREIALLRGGAEQPSGAVWISDLRADVIRSAGDAVDCELWTGRPGNIFEAGQPVVVKAGFRAPAGTRAFVKGTVLDFLGREQPIDPPDMLFGESGEAVCNLACPVDGEGSYVLRLKADSQTWYQRFAVLADTPAPRHDPASQFGIWGNVARLSRAEQPLADRLNRQSGCAWTRIGFNWPQINPRPGVFAWDGAARTDGAVGRALIGGTATLEVPDDPSFDLPGGLTIAFWSKLAGGNGNWQWLVYREGPAGERGRGWGVFFSRDTGELVFSAGFADQPERPHADLGSGFKAWDDQWHHCAVAHDPTARAISFYVDGKLARRVESPGGVLRPVRSPLRLASSYDGLLDELRIYDRPLPAADIAALAAKQPGPAAGLVAGWTFDEPKGDFRDSSGHGFHLATAEPQPAQLARQAREQGIATLGILGFPPEWASTAPAGASRPWVYEPKLDAWETYVEATVRHYAGLVDHWELWNEPNISVFWEPEPDAETFAKIAVAGYRAAKRGNPNAVVMTPGLAGPHGHGGRMEFLDTILAVGVKDATDAVSIHPYRQTTPEESDLVGELRHIRNASGGKPIWYTEMCWTNQIPGGSTETRTAQMLARCFALSIGSGLVDKIIWFRFHDPGVDRFYTEHNYGLCWNDLTPKPAWFAFRTCARLLDHAVPASDWDLGSGAMGRLFETANGRVAVLWAPDGIAPAAVRVGVEQVTQVDLMGNANTVATPGGVWLGDLGESAIFLTGLGRDAAPAAGPLAVEAPRLTVNSGGQILLRLNNPTAQPAEARLLLTVGKGLRLAGDAPVGIPLAAGERRELPIAVVAGATPGVWPLTVAMELGGRTVTRAATIGIHTNAADAGPIGWWKFDEGQGATIADSSPSGLAGTVEAPQWVSGKRGTALQFEAGPIATVPPSPLLDLADEVTVAFWIQPMAETGTWQFPLTRFFNANMRRNYGIYLTPSDLKPAFSTSPVDEPAPHRDVVAGLGLTIGQWHHVAASYSLFDGVCRVYVDGQVSATQQLGGAMKLVPDEPLRIGVGAKAVIDEVMIWPRALSDEEVARLAE